MESVVFGDPSSFGNKPDTGRARQQLHQLTREQRIVNCKLSHMLSFFCLPLTSSWLHHIAIMLADAPDSTFDQAKQECSEMSLCLKFIRAGSPPNQPETCQHSEYCFTAELSRSSC